MKKTLAILLSLVMVFALVSASAYAEPTDETLTVWCWDESFNIAAMKTAAKYYQAAGHENFSLNIVDVVEDDVMTKLATAFSAGVTEELPDIVLMGDSWAKMYLVNYAGCFVDLTDNIDFSEFAPYKVSCFTVDDRVYGIPFDSGSAGLFYRTDILEQAGYTAEDLKDITIWDFLEIGKAIKEKTGNYAIAIDPSSGCGFTWFDSYQQSSGEWFYDANDPEENADFANNQVVRELSEFLKEACQSGIVYRTETANSATINAIQDGEVACVLNAIWYAPSIMGDQSAAGKWSYTNVPTLTTVETSKYTNIGGSSWTILSTSEKQDLAIDFMKTVWAGNKEFYDEILLGQSAVATWLPASDSDVYNTPVEFFSGKSLYADFASWGANIPSVDFGSNTWTVNGAVNGTLADYVDGIVDLDTYLENLQSAYDTMK